MRRPSERLTRKKQLIIGHTGIGQEQYRKYIEVTGIYDLNRLLEPKDEEILPPSPENPLVDQQVCDEIVCQPLDPE